MFTGSLEGRPKQEEEKTLDLSRRGPPADDDEEEEEEEEGSTAAGGESLLVADPMDAEPTRSNAAPTSTESPSKSVRLLDGRWN